MLGLRTSVITFVDTVQSTPKIAALTQAELTTLLNTQKQFVSQIVAQNEGSIIKGEGDSFWILFPSVTTAALAAIDIQRNSHSIQAGGRSEQERLSLRIAISAGDVLHKDGDVFGLAMALAARIETVTPPDEIYLSHGAWLMLNKAEVSTDFVNEFSLKGIPVPERVYRIDQPHRTRILHNQYMVFTDTRGFTHYTQTKTIAEVEQFLLEFDDLVVKLCGEYGGIIRNVAGDQYFLTFADLEQTLAMLGSIQREWDSFEQRYQLGLSIGVNHGDVNIVRSYVYGSDINVAALTSHVAANLAQSAPTQCFVTVTSKVRDAAQGTAWASRCREIDAQQITDERLKQIAITNGAYHFS
jgi:class 3 adenylate cyclase